jgi:hypothetical protein
MLVHFGASGGVGLWLVCCLGVSGIGEHEDVIQVDDNKQQVAKDTLHAGLVFVRGRGDSHREALILKLAKGQAKGRVGATFFRESASVVAHVGIKRRQAAQQNLADLGHEVGAATQEFVQCSEVNEQTQCAVGLGEEECRRRHF